MFMICSSLRLSSDLTTCLSWCFLLTLLSICSFLPQGRIACANVLSDLYAMGVCDISTTLMTLSVSTQMNPKEQSVVTSELIRGYSDAAAEAETSVTGGQTVLNPWPIVGGVAMSVGTGRTYSRAVKRGMRRRVQERERDTREYIIYLHSGRHRLRPYIYVYMICIHIYMYVCVCVCVCVCV